MNIGFITIHVKSLDETIKFYQEIMDFKVVRRFTASPKAEIAFMADNNGSQLEFIQNSDEGVEHNDLISIGFNVEDIEATESYLKKNNVKIVEGPITLPSGVKLMQARDLNCVALGFVQHP